MIVSSPDHCLSSFTYSSILQLLNERLIKLSTSNKVIDICVSIE